MDQIISYRLSQSSLWDCVLLWLLPEAGKGIEAVRVYNSIHLVKLRKIMGKPQPNLRAYLKSVTITTKPRGYTEAASDFGIFCQRSDHIWNRILRVFSHRFYMKKKNNNILKHLKNTRNKNGFEVLTFFKSKAKRKILHEICSNTWPYHLVVFNVHNRTTNRLHR